MTKKLTKEQIEYALRCSKGSLAMEGLESPKEIEWIYRDMLEGEITKEQAEKEILAYHGIKKT